MVGVSDGLEDDWFESAVENDASDDGDGAAPDGDAEGEGGADAPAEQHGGAAPEAAADEANADAGDDPDDPDDPEDGGSLFEDDFADALAGAGPDAIPDDDAEGFGEALDVDDGFDEADGDPLGAEFDVGGGGEFGMEGFDAEFGTGGGFDEGFEEEEFESELPRIELGIKGLDEMIQGGIPERSLMVTIGSAGTGKTTFGLQFLNHALSQGEKAIYITLEESRSRVVNSATEKGWAFDEYVDEGRLAVVDIDPIEMANSLASIRSELPRLIDEFGASRLVLDSVSLLEMMYDDRATRRNEIYDFTKSLKRAGVTTMLTSEASQDSAYASRHGIVEYLTDAVFILQYVRPSDFRETRLAVEIQKIRDANHSRETKPYEITNEGISVYRQANIF
ncbi:KaiC domain-containing protein [Halostella litorea]|uniref:KaiC domain-containing protein n=1 Tax=Halostella litorea TaxID=2528831 RepID=UPI0035C0C0B3